MSKIFYMQPEDGSAETSLQSKLWESIESDERLCKEVGKVYTHNTTESTVIFSTTHRDTSLLLSAMSESTRYLMALWLIEVFAGGGASTHTICLRREESKTAFEIIMTENANGAVTFHIQPRDHSNRK